MKLLVRSWQVFVWHINAQMTPRLLRYTPFQHYFGTGRNFLSPVKLKIWIFLMYVLKCFNVKYTKHSKGDNRELR